MKAEPSKSPKKTPQKKVPQPKALSTTLSVKEDAEHPEAASLYEAITRVAALLTSAETPDGEGGEGDMVVSYHFVVMAGGSKTEYRNTVTLPAVLSPDNEVDALSMIEAQMDLATRPAKNFAMRKLRESRDTVLRIV